MKLLWPVGVARRVTGRGRSDSGFRMSECPFQVRIEAYHDGELAADERPAVERHVATCPACAANLAWLRGVSRSLATTQAGMTTAERGRLRDALDAAMDRDDAEFAYDDSDEPESYPISLYRTAGVLSAIAASILLLSVVWLNELPSRTQRPPTGAALARGEVPAWERVAVNLRVDPLPNTTPGGEAYMADARLADWMLQGLAPGAGQNLQQTP
jgi:anti-sigma factor RsiW